jgi:hypothetical protein
MKPYDRVTIIRNRARARDLRMFRARIRVYFEQFEYDPEEVPVDWDVVRAARAEINRLLPRVIQIVEAAELGASTGVSVRNPLHSIFSARYTEGHYQEILDLLDMAVGVYDANQPAAWMRTLNPLYYVMTALGFLAGLPRRALVAIGLLPERSGRIAPDSATRLEAALSRLASTNELIETRFADMREWQSRLLAEHAEHLKDMAERMDFVERVMAQQQPPQRLKPGEKNASTPA